MIQVTLEAGRGTNFHEINQSVVLGFLKTKKDERLNFKWQAKIRETIDERFNFK